MNILYMFIRTYRMVFDDCQWHTHLYIFSIYFTFSLSFPFVVFTWTRIFWMLWGQFITVIIVFYVISCVNARVFRSPYFCVHFVVRSGALYFIVGPRQRVTNQCGWIERISAVETWNKNITLFRYLGL